MSLTTTADIMTAVGITDTSQEARIDNLRKKVEAAVINYLKWNPEVLIDTVDYYDGSGKPDITLRRPFVKDVDSVKYDPTGYYGDGANAFGTGSAMTKGSDYVLRREGPLGKAGLLRRISIASNLLFPSDMLFFGQAGGLSFSYPPFWPVGYGNVKVTYTSGWPSALAVSTIAWASSVATVTTSAKHGLAVEDRFTLSGVTPSGYDGDYTVASVADTTHFTYALASNPGAYSSGGTIDAIPPDIKLAVATAVMVVMNTVQKGWPVQSETGGDYSYSLAISRDAEFGTVRDLLGRYRDTALGVGIV